jgi:hypothetical protein
MMLHRKDYPPIGSLTFTQQGPRIRFEFPEEALVFLPEKFNPVPRVVWETGVLEKTRDMTV